MKVYFLSGLGADERAFKFLDLSFCEPVFIRWLKPLHKESLQDYALRIREEIPEENPVLAGYSFGGMLATEIAKTNNSIKAIILSSAKAYFELPPYFKLTKNLTWYRSLSPAIIRRIMLNSNWLFGARGKEQIKTFRSIIRDSNLDFDFWAIDAILHWRNSIVPDNIIHIHGTADKLLPYRYVKADYSINKGTHMMVMNNYAEISKLLKKIVEE